MTAEQEQDLDAFAQWSALTDAAINAEQATVNAAPENPAGLPWAPCPRCYGLGSVAVRARDYGEGVELDECPDCVGDGLAR